MLKKASVFLTLGILVLNSSCGKESTIKNVSFLPPSVVDQFKEQGFVSVSGNAYPSVGMIAKETDSSGKNHAVELDNPFKYNLNDKPFSYFSFIVTTKEKATDGDPVFNIIKDNGSNLSATIIEPPKNAELEFMSNESLKYNGDKTSPALFSNDLAQKLFQHEVLYWKNTEKITGERTYSFLVKSDLIKAFKVNAAKTSLKVKFKLNPSFEDSINLVRSPIHVAIIGDSVMWGQGLKRENYLFANLKKSIENKKGNFVRYANYARSGAAFGKDDDIANIDLNGEIASKSPSINAQLKRVNEDYKPYEGENKVELKIDPKRIDLLIMDGGINNVGPTTIFLGFNPNKVEVKEEEVKSVLLDYDGTEKVNANFSVKDLTSKIIEILKAQDPNYKDFRKLVNSAYCYSEERNDFSGCQPNVNENNVQAILENTRKIMPNAQVDIMGYFPLINDNSKLTCNSPMTLTNPATNKPVTVNLGSSAFLGLSTYMLLADKISPEMAIIVAGSVGLAGKGLLSVIKNSAVKRSSFWTNHSNMILSKAVQNVSANTNGRGLVRYLPIAHKFEKNTAFSANSYMWGIDQNKCFRDGMYFPPEDDVWQERKEMCANLPKSGFEKFMCERFSMFHPNNKGYEKVYLPEIEDSLKFSGFLNRDDL